MATSEVSLRNTQLRAYERVIKQGQKTFVEVGQALLKIREGRLYREAGFATFDAYCQERWGWGRSYAGHLIRASEVGTNVPNEGAARALRSVPEPRRAEVMERVEARVAQTGEPLTARLISETADPTNDRPAGPISRCRHCDIHCPKEG